jgi:hypothetical protein
MTEEPLSWQVIQSQGGLCHVVPHRDLKPHAIARDWRNCWCGPTEDDGVIIHHSMDRREFYESGETKKQ